MPHCLHPILGVSPAHAALRAKYAAVAALVYGNSRTGLIVVDRNAFRDDSHRMHNRYEVLDNSERVVGLFRSKIAAWQFTVNA